ncbi:MAG: outer membrane beta-barrel protein [Saprospiraceae bacterium]|jgi:hypothetical protein
MKQFIFASLFVLVCSTAHAQFFSFGLKGGVNTQVKKPSDISVVADTAFNFGVENFKFGTQFGAYFRFGNKIFIQPEILLNSSRTDYRVSDGNLGEIVKSEKYQNLDLPILVGFKLGPVRVMGGPVGHYFLNSTSELTDFEGYSERFDQMTWGYQAGLSIGVGRISADIRYEGNFYKAGEQVNFYGKSYSFANNPSRLIVGINIAIIK